MKVPDAVIDKAEFIPQGINRTAANVSDVQGISWESIVDFKYLPKD